MSKIIALKGRHQSGKTPTLKKLKQLITSRFNVQPNQIKELGKDDYGDNRNDICVFISGINNLNIGIFSEGDYPDRLHKYISDLISRKSDIIFCACRTRGQTKETIESFQPQHIVKLIKKDYCKNITQQDNVNFNQAKALLKEAGL